MLWIWITENDSIILEEKSLNPSCLTAWLQTRRRSIVHENIPIQIEASLFGFLSCPYINMRHWSVKLQCIGRQCWYMVNILVKPVKIWLTKPMHTKQIIDNVQKRKSTFKEIPIEEIANVLPAFKQLSINKPLPKINGLRSLPLFLWILVGSRQTQQYMDVLHWNQYQIQWEANFSCNSWTCLAVLSLFHHTKTLMHQFS